MSGIGLPELVVVLIIVLLLFGTGRIGRVGKELGTAINDFRKSLSDGKSEK